MNTVTQQNREFTENEIYTIYAKILKMKKRLIESKRKLESADLNELVPDVGDNETLARLLKDRVHEIEEIEDSLARIEEGRYGVCERCNQDIPKERLAARPEARYCVACERLIEILEEQKSRPSIMERRDFNS